MQIWCPDWSPSLQAYLALKKYYFWKKNNVVIFIGFGFLGNGCTYNVCCDKIQTHINKFVVFFLSDMYIHVLIGII